MTPSQMRMARAGLKIGVRDLAKMAGVTTATITRYENEHADLLASTRDKIQRALEEAGVEFLPENGEGPGVRLKKR
ncbi:LacI family DNA-binding transcriptional regulator [Neorhizobium sp. Rsf11]|uniref:LacI family DNA-binding transcriptional regulator n=1 Tax=Neorhizobium phenanthreniclasticum TaxID=3157917 RepID=A0ABV0M555_9HYPH